jgi:hypothetical protein
MGGVSYWAQAQAYAAENQHQISTAPRPPSMRSINGYGFVTCSEMLTSRMGT